MNIILLIEDDELTRSMVAGSLRKDHFEVLEAENGALGLNELRMHEAEPPSIVITDIIMPDKEGFETIKEIKKFSPHIKIIAISGGGDAQDKKMLLDVAMMLGADKTLQKPFKSEELLEAVRILLAPS